MSTHSQSPEPSAPLSSQTKHHGSGRHWTDEESAQPTQKKIASKSGWEDSHTESGSDGEPQSTRTKGKKPQDQWDSDEEARPSMAKGRPNPKVDVEKHGVRLTKKKAADLRGTKPGQKEQLHHKKREDQDQWDSDVEEEEARPNRTKAVKFLGSEKAAQKDQWDSVSDVEKQEVQPIKKKAATVKGTGTEPGSDEEARPMTKAANFEGTKPKSVEEVWPKPKVQWDLDLDLEKQEVQPTKKKAATKNNFNVKGTVAEPGLDDEARPTKKTIDNLKPKAKPGPSESFWELDFAEPLGGHGVKRKYSDNEEDALPNKTSQLEAGYKLGPKNGRPGTIKKAAGSPVVQDVSIDKPSTEVDPHAGRSPSTNIDLVKLAMAVPVKAIMLSIGPRLSSGLFGGRKLGLAQ